MFGRSEKIWKQYPQNIAAVNNREALYLLHYITYIHITKYHLNVMEILDVQRYRIIRKKNKVAKTLALPIKESSFLFPFNKN